MKPIKLKVKTFSETYPVIIGSNLVEKLDKYLKKNSIDFNQCLLVIDKRIPTSIEKIEIDYEIQNLLTSTIKSI